MAHDLIIRGGDVLDGTGASARRLDVAVDGDTITLLADDLGDAEADRVMDATGKVVTPGFIDVHTHLDAQVGWDPELRSSSYHGVTTVLMGNCGVTFAPAAPEHHRDLAELMESVEDIAADAISDGLPWSWGSYGDYLDAVQRLQPALNVVGMVGHSAVRLDVMGDRSCDRDAQPTDVELRRMCEHVRRSCEEGAVGFSTSRFLGHVVPDGRKTPGTWADGREIGALQEAVVEGGGPGGLYQVVPDFQTRLAEDIAMWEHGADVGCQVVFSGGTFGEGDGGLSFVGNFLDASKEKGRRITTLAHTRPSGGLFGLVQLCPFDTPGWKELMARPTVADRVEALRDPASRTRLCDEAKARGFRVPPASLHPLGLGPVPDYDLDRRASLADLAEEAGADPVDVLVDRLVESEGRELSNFWLFGTNLDAQWRYFQLEDCVPLLGDAGAHVGQLIDADSTTFLLADLARDRGVFTVPEAVRRLTSHPAGLLGLKDRGQIRAGWRADLNVIDLERLSTAHPEYVHDFPHGVGRFVVRSSGYDATVVGGRIVVEDGRHTGERPGVVIREFARS